MHHVRSWLLPVAGLFAFAACDHDPPLATPGLDAATAQQLFERMDRLIAALQATTTATPTASSLVPAATAPSDRVAAAPELAVLVARLEALEQAVARGRGIAAAHATPLGTFTPVPQRATAVIETLAAQLHDGDNQNDELRREARRAYFRMPEQQLLQRLGLPDEVEIEGSGRANWTFRSTRHSVYVKLDGGIVADISGWVGDG